MLTFDEMEYHPSSERLVDILCNKTQNGNPLFFRVLVAYYFSLVASMMRCSIKTHDQGLIPVNLYALNLSTSGSGKGKSSNIIKNQVINQFRERFMNETLHLLADQNLPKLANKRAQRKSTDPDEELIRVQKEFDDIGPMLFTFSEGTTPAIKQLRHKMLMVTAGSLNLQIDEIGSNLIGSEEVLKAYLELYDMGLIDPKLIKSGPDSRRFEEIIGSAPTNMLLFGTPSKLLNGGKIEEELYSMLDTGYARRCFFGYSRANNNTLHMTPEEIYNRDTDHSSDTWLDEFSDKLDRLADIINMNRPLIVSKETSLLLIEYRLKCQQEASFYPEHEEIKKAEHEHRYFKSLKLAGAYAFIDDSPELTTAHLYNAIKLAEESGAAFQRLLTRDKHYVKLAKYIASVKSDVTHADLTEDLPFYRGSTSQKQDMLALAMSWGYKNNVIIKKSFSDGVECLRGETLKEADLSQMTVAYSTDMTEGYLNERVAFDKLHIVTQRLGLHWINHHLNGGYRNEENAINGFNFVVIDVDGGVNLSTAKLLLKGYRALYYTTKRHTDEKNRFRILLPINYELTMDAKDYREFYKNLLEWLPFDADAQCGHRCKKWLSHDGHYEYADGDLLDALPFIPKTSKNEERKELMSSQQSMDNLERWVINNIGDGNRNNMLLRYSMLLLDSGFDFDGIRQRVIGLNEKIPDKLDESEIMGTVMRTVMTTIAKR